MVKSFGYSNAIPCLFCGNPSGKKIMKSLVVIHISYLTKVRKIQNRGLDSMVALASTILREKVILCAVVKINRDMKKLKSLLTFSTRNMHTKNVAYVLMKTIWFRFFLTFTYSISLTPVKRICWIHPKHQKIEIENRDTHQFALEKQSKRSKIDKTRNFRGNEFTYVVRRPRTMPNMINKMASNTRYRVHIIFVNRQKVLTYYDLSRFLMESFQFLTHYDLTRFLKESF